MKVAIVGAGVSGVVAGAHLKAAGIDITVFERLGEAGGVWLYDERLQPEPTYPSIRPSEADFRLDEGGNLNGGQQQRCQFDASEAVKHAPPGPCYEGLSNNVSTRLMKLKINSWPKGTPDYVNHRVLNEYIQDTSRKSGVHSRTMYNTRVEKIYKDGQVWKVQTSTLMGNQGALHKVDSDWVFEAVVIASGHYHACRIPDIPGLATWKKQWPTRVQHSKAYRHPSGFKDQNVLLIGAGVSSTDIAREIAAEANQIYQVSRGGAFDLPTTFLPPRAIRIRGEVLTFESPVTANAPSGHVDAALDPIPGHVVFKDGRTLAGIHRVILCTGYHISLPFLPQYHDDDTPVQAADENVLVTDGTMVHNLHRDIWYIPDPSLVFIGVPFFTATFSLFEFQAIAVAAVMGGDGAVPGEGEMRREYGERVRMKGTGKEFHSLKGREVEYVDGLLERVNGGERGVVEGGVGRRVVEGHTREWHVANRDREEEMKLRMTGGGDGS